ncbi:hypothetical protein AGOR_G00237460 [Albula goreensis]|uniref:Uncharacterized protein n=1 Tax=Albula goreensis TaxID=1534307 RepID=A0A8T3CFI4_9TELE|nr:hypothetical protein AGOR_G00237460 [Albula goreensis]
MLQVRPELFSVCAFKRSYDSNPKWPPPEAEDVAQNDRQVTQEAQAELQAVHGWEVVPLEQAGQLCADQGLGRRERMGGKISFISTLVWMAWQEAAGAQRSRDERLQS